MRTELDSPPSAEQLWDALTDFDGGGYRTGAWSEYLRMHRGRGVVGEVRKPADWDRVPYDQPVRVLGVAEPDGVVIRWVAPNRDTQHAKGLLTFHADMVRRDDQGKAIRSGWVEVRRSGKTIVSSG